MKLNIGSGQRRFGMGWINVDLVSRPPDQVPDVIADGGRLPFRNESADLVVLHHVLEHFGCGEATNLLIGCWDILAPGGRLLVFVPDLKMLARRWLCSQLDNQLYMTQLYGAYQGLESDRHRWGFSFDSLMAYLTVSLPESVIFPYLPRHIEGADIALDWYIAGIECRKNMR